MGKKKKKKFSFLLYYVALVTLTCAPIVHLISKVSKCERSVVSLSSCATSWHFHGWGSGAAHPLAAGMGSSDPPQARVQQEASLENEWTNDLFLCAARLEFGLRPSQPDWLWINLIRLEVCSITINVEPFFFFFSRLESKGSCEWISRVRTRTRCHDLVAAELIAERAAQRAREGL